MSGNRFYIILISVLILGAGFYFFNSPNKSSDLPVTTPSDSAATKKQTADEGAETVMETAKYIKYAPGVLEENNNKKRVLFFYANWCPTCKPIDTELLNSSENIPEDVVIIRVNYNDSDTDANSKQLAAKYGVTYQHTFVEIDSNENIVQSWNGGGLSILLSKIK